MQSELAGVAAEDADDGGAEAGYWGEMGEGGRHFWWWSGCAVEKSVVVVVRLGEAFWQWGERRPGKPCCCC